MTAPANNKQAQRQAAFQKRLRVPAATAKQASHQMMENFLREVPLKEGGIIAGYWPVNAEINVMPLLVQLLHKGYACALPQVIKKMPPLIFRSWNEKMPMQANMYNIKEPDPTKSAIVRPDVVIVPLLAFDAAGHRLGYGAGCYDQALRHLKSTGQVLAVGVAYDLQKIDKVLAEPHDCPMDMVVTERTVYRIQAAAAAGGQAK